MRQEAGRLDSQSIRFLVFRATDDRYVRTQSGRQFDGHMTQASHSDDTDTAAGPTFHVRRGEYVVMPAQSSGAAFDRSQTVRYSQDKFFPDDEIFG